MIYRVSVSPLVCSLLIDPHYCAIFRNLIKIYIGNGHCWWMTHKKISREGRNTFYVWCLNIIGEATLLKQFITVQGRSLM